MVGAHQNLNGSRDLTMTFQGSFVILATINLPTKFEVSITTHYEDMKREMWKMGWFGVVRSHPRSLKIVSFNKVHMIIKHISCP